MKKMIWTQKQNEKKRLPIEGRPLRGTTGRRKDHVLRKREQKYGTFTGKIVENTSRSMATPVGKKGKARHISRRIRRRAGGKAKIASIYKSGRVRNRWCVGEQLSIETKKKRDTPAQNIKKRSHSHLVKEKGGNTGLKKPCKFIVPEINIGRPPGAVSRRRGSPFSRDFKRVERHGLRRERSLWAILIRPYGGGDTPRYERSGKKAGSGDPAKLSGGEFWGGKQTGLGTPSRQKWKKRKGRTTPVQPQILRPARLFPGQLERIEKWEGGKKLNLSRRAG